MATKKQTGLAIPASAYPIINPEQAADALDIVQTNLGEGGVKISDLDKVTVPPGGGKNFTVVTAEGEQTEQTLTGIIVLAPQQNGYWPKPIEEDPAAAPICFSADGRTGNGDPFQTGSPGRHDCATCPMKQWGTDAKGRGKACRDLRPLYLLRPGEFLPTIVQTSRMSLKRVSQYFTRLAKSGIPYYGVVTEIGLAQESKPGTPTYSYLTFAMQEALTGTQATAIKAYQQTLIAQATQPPAAADITEQTAAPTADDYDPFAEENKA